MKVCLLAPTPPPYGGIAGWTKRMLAAKLDNEWEVCVVDTKVIGKRTVFGSASKIRIVSEIKRCFIIWRNLIKTLKDNDVVVVQTCIPAGTRSMLREIVSALIVKIHGRKFITHFRCTIPNMVQGGISKLLFEILCRMSDMMFVLNTPSAEFIKKCLPKADYRMIPNFIETGALYKNRLFRERIERVVYVGGVIPEKGCDYIAKIAAACPEITFILVGKIGMDKNVFPQNVTLLGELEKEKVQMELKSADLFLFLSRFQGEGFSNALAEAMASSMPCIVTDWAANADMIEDKGGVVVKDDPYAETISALHMMQDSAVRKEMGYWCCNKVESQYLDTTITKQYVDAYEALIRTN